MARKTMIKVRRDVTGNWTDVVLAEGETGYDTTTKQIKVGTGDTAFQSLQGIDADTLDGLHGSSYEVTYARTLIVMASGGDYTKLSEALTSISDSSASNRYLIKVYGDIADTAACDWKSYVDVRGYNARVTVTSNSAINAVNVGSGIVYSICENVVFVRAGTSSRWVQDITGGDRTVKFVNCAFINESSSGSDHYGGYAHSGSISLLNCTFTGGVGSTGAGFINGGYGGSNCLFVNCTFNSLSTNSGSHGLWNENNAGGIFQGCEFTGGGSSHGALFLNSSCPTMYDCNFNAGSEGYGVSCDDVCVPVFHDCEAFGSGLDTWSQCWNIVDSASPVLINCRGGMDIYEDRCLWEASLTNGRFRPYADHPYMLLTIYIKTHQSLPGITVDLGTTVGGHEIAENIDISGYTVGDFFKFNHVEIAAGGYIYITPSGTCDDYSFSVWYTVAKNYTGCSALSIDSMGAFNIIGGEFIGNAQSYGMYLNTRVDTSPMEWKITGAVIGTLGTGDAIYSEDAITTAPIYNCTIQGSLHNITNVYNCIVENVPMAPTAAVGTSTTQVATTAFVNAEIANDAARISESSATFTPAAGGVWHRIATSVQNIGRCRGTFEVTWYSASDPWPNGTLIFNAGHTYGVTAQTNIEQTIYSWAYSAGITKARVVYHTTATGNYAYVELYYPVTLTNLVVTVRLLEGVGFTLTTPDTAGSIPSGYTSKELTFVIGKATTGQIRSEIATGTSPLAVSSTTVNTNLNADLLDDQHGSYYRDATNLNAGYVHPNRLSQNLGTYALDPQIPISATAFRTHLSDHTTGALALFPGYVFDGLAQKIPSTIEFTRNGTDWIAFSSGEKDATKQAFSGDNSGAINIAIKNGGTGGDPSGAWQALRLIWNGADWAFYYFFKYLYMYYSTSGHTGLAIKIEASKYDTPTTWVEFGNYTGAAGWPGHFFASPTALAWSFYTIASHYRNLRITFTPTWNAAYPNNNINIYMLKYLCTYPAGDTSGKPFTFDYDREITTFGGINIPTSKTFKINGTDILANKVVGPASATDNAIVRYDSTTGKLVQDSLATVDDTGNINIPTDKNITVNGANPKRSIMLLAQDGRPSSTGGCGALTTYTGASTVLPYFPFVHEASERAEWIFLMPDNWDGGVVNATVYWSTSSMTGNDVNWIVSGRSHGDSEQFGTMGSSVSIVDTNPGVSYGLCKTAQSGDITLAGTPAGGELVTLHITRFHDGSDTLAADIMLIGIKLEYGINKHSE